MSVKVDNLKAVLKALEGIALDNVLVGVPEDKSGREAKEGEPAGPINNAQLAMIHEYGSPAAHIPARPFLEPGIIHSHAEIVADLREGAKEVLDTLNPKAAGKSLNKAGMHASTQVKKEFTDNNWEPLKQPRGKKGRSHRKGAAVVEKPLIDTGALRASISDEIKKTG
jgi:phage gpG-like protein